MWIENLKSWFKLGTGLGVVYSGGLLLLYGISASMLTSLSLPMVPKEFINTASLPMFLLYLLALVIFTGIIWGLSGLLSLVVDPLLKHIVNKAVPRVAQYQVRLWIPSVALALLFAFPFGAFNLMNFIVVQLMMLLALFFALIVLKMAKHPVPALRG